MKKAIVLVLAFVFILSAAAMAEVETKFYGYQWVRYDLQYLGTAETASMLNIPRTYLRWKIKDADMGYEGNLTLDINNTQYGQGVTITGATGSIDWAVWVKYGYITLNKLPFLQDMGMAVKAGIQPVYFGAVDTWDYPVIERSLEDRSGVMCSADNGLALTGKFPADWGGYEVAMYNGGGYKKLEDNAEKAGLASLLISPMPEIYGRVSFYRNLTNALGSAAQIFTATAAIAGFKIGQVEGFGEYLVKNSAKDAAAVPGKSGVGEGWSIFLNYHVINELALLARYDNWNPDTFVALDEMNTFIAGINYVIAKDAVLLQLNYQLDQPKYRGSNILNANQWLAQVKWSW
jgi:hypothetical protein